MTNELVESENQYFILCDLLLKRVASKYPSALSEMKAFVAKLEGFNVYEKTFYVAELLEALEDKQEAQQSQQIAQVLQKNNIPSGIISLLQQYSPWVK